MAIDLSKVPPDGAPLGDNNGESEGVYPVRDRPDVLLKIYKPHCATPEDADRLDWLIERAKLAPAADRAMLAKNCCWPVERVTGRGRAAYGVLLPRAPAKFETTMLISKGKTRRISLEVDWLACPADKCRRHHIPVPTFEQRLGICTDIVKVADFLERNELVYGDWSYSNAFWSHTDHSGYLIDIDGCGFRKRRTVATPNWSDPINSGTTDNLTDRFGLALLLARCLTGTRDIGPALTELRTLAATYSMGNLFTTINAGVKAGVREDRPKVGELLAALRGRSTGTTSAESRAVRQRPASGVVGWRAPGSSTTPAQPPSRPSTPRPQPTPSNSRPVPRTPAPATTPYRSAASSPGRSPSSPTPQPSSGLPGWVVLAVVLIVIVFLVLLLS